MSDYGNLIRRLRVKRIQVKSADGVVRDYYGVRSEAADAIEALQARVRELEAQTTAMNPVHLGEGSEVVHGAASLSASPLERENAELRAHVNALRDSLKCCFALQGCDEPDCPDGGCVAARNRESVLTATPAQSLADVQARARAEALKEAWLACEWVKANGKLEDDETCAEDLCVQRIRALAAEKE